LTSELKVGEWYSVGVSSTIYSVPWNSEEQFVTTEVGAGTPFLLISIDFFISAVGNKAYDLKILINGNLKYLSPNENELNKLSRIT
jgi:hypothetical protein